MLHLIHRIHVRVQVNLRDELVTDLSIIVNETNNIGYLVRCSNINRQAEREREGIEDLVLVFFWGGGVGVSVKQATRGF